MSEHFWQGVAASMATDCVVVVRDWQADVSGSTYGIVLGDGAAGGDGKEAQEGDEGGKGLHGC
jgi:hypothetical protein